MELIVLIKKEIQIEVLLYGDPFGFACEMLDVENMRSNSYSEVFTVNFEEVYEYIQLHGLPQTESSSRHPMTEGFHYYKENGRWHTFFKERGCIFDEKSFDEDESGKRYIVRTLLKLRGTDLF
ncbi:hypothetical protein [Salinicoccus halitifaciens]|nr:hypothetical protein [Salinicoccus halitifaciens]